MSSFNPYEITHFDAAPPRDAPKERFVYFSDGNYARLVREDPFGFIRIVWGSGATPSALAGQFTDFAMARAEVERFINNGRYQKYASVVDKPVEKAPPIIYRRRKQETQEQTTEV